jgi:glycerophosphoryl diester phosphodiesterase
VDEVIATIQRVGAAGFGSQSNPEHFDAEFVRQLQAAGIDQFHVWTVDDPEVARFYERLGACGITTNRPGFMRAELAR